MSTYEPTDRTKVKRLPERGAYDAETVHAILDEALICHVGFVADGAPVVIPTIHARVGGTVYIHGSVASRMLRTLRQGVDACLTVTLLDGLVMARSVFHHSMNYRSVVAFGTMREVSDPAERLSALTAIVEHVAPGRTADAREPNRIELAKTSVLAMELGEVSAKIRSGPPGDDEEDYALPVWAGVVPLALTPSAPVSDPRLTPGIEVPEYLKNYRR